MIVVRVPVDTYAVDDTIAGPGYEEVFLAIEDILSDGVYSRH
jgi:hypothetical protein